MNEKIEEIALSIKKHRDLEISAEKKNEAVGRVNTLYYSSDQSAEKLFWIITQPPSYQSVNRDFLNNVDANSANRITTAYIGDGHPVERDSLLGGVLIQNLEGLHSYKTPKGVFNIEIFNRAIYVPSKENDDYANNISITISGENRTHFFENIKKILSLKLEKEELERLHTISIGKEAEELQFRIKQKEEEIQLYTAKTQGFIRKYAELRYQPILDSVQDKIKRSMIFKGTLIINGGPGTGKTTSLIQRIKFLISPTIIEYINLTKDQSDLILNEKSSWIFYSPNKLLALFLRNSMVKEGLTANEERVKVWNEHKVTLIKAYKIVDTSTQRPFLMYNKPDAKSLFTNDSEGIKFIISDLNNYFLELQLTKLRKVLGINVTKFNWKRTGESIQNYLKDKLDINNTKDLILLFINLNETYKNESDAISNNYSKSITQVASVIQVEILKDIERKENLSDILKQWKNSKQDNEDDDDELDIESEDFGEKNEQSSFDFESELFNKIKSLCRKQALKKYDSDTKFTKNDKELLILIPELENQSVYDEIGQDAFFKKHIERITKGILANILREVPMAYKKFRREQLKTENNLWKTEILKDLVTKDENKRIHADEQALLLCFVNNVCQNIAQNFKNQFEIINHPFIKAYKVNCKPVIGVDEATDFALIDLIAINSFRHPEISSLTLSGDIMQRMTNEGIKNWEAYSGIVANTEQMDLKISYRQSSTLLSLAKAIYEKSTLMKAEYVSYSHEDESEPKPLILVSQNEDYKIEWIANRIHEIYKVYDSFPSIAIFLPEESQIDDFSKRLGELDILADVGINVIPCRDGAVLGNIDTVRVFSIANIKGLEFEAVFFHNLDDLLEMNLSSEILLKYLYVGLSRATFYLGLTVNKELSGELEFLSNYLETSNKNWSLD